MPQQHQESGLVGLGLALSRRLQTVGNERNDAWILIMNGRQIIWQNEKLIVGFQIKRYTPFNATSTVLKAVITAFKHAPYANWGLLTNPPSLQVA
jgi:hypothetical protein